jgi:4-hydroxy-tetrahydrodipicolinate synthase
MSDRPPIQGVLPVFQTPYHDDESIDFDTLSAEIDWLYERGVDGLVMAMVSEVLRQSTDERERLAEFVCGKGRDRGVVIISVGSESHHTTKRLARHAEEVGADAVMAIPPVSVGLGENELQAYYERILENVVIPVIVQDASGYVGRPMSIELQAALHKQYGDRVMFKPEAIPSGPRLTALHEATGHKASVFEGSGGIALMDNHQRGITGTMPGADLIEALVAMWRALESGNHDQARRISLPLTALISVQNSLDAFLAVQKHLLVRQGVFTNTIVRGPVGFHLDEPTRAEVDRLFDLLMDVAREGAQTDR